MSKSHTHTAPTSEACTFRRSPYFLTATYCFNQQPIAEHNVQVTHTHTHTHTHTLLPPLRLAIRGHHIDPVDFLGRHLRVHKSQISGLHFYTFCVHIHLPLQNVSKAICVCASLRSVNYTFTDFVCTYICPCKIYRRPSACAQFTDQWVTIFHILCCSFCVHAYLPLQNFSGAICTCTHGCRLHTLCCTHCAK